jgi:hypothetical protein
LKWYVVEEITKSKMKVLAGPFATSTEMAEAADKIQQRFTWEHDNVRGAPYRVVTALTSEEWETFESKGGSVEY